MERADHRAVMGPCPGVCRRTLFLFLLVLLIACGGEGVRKPFRAEADTLAYATELADARGMLNDGRAEEGESVARMVYDATKESPGLARQQVQALSLLGLAQQRRHKNDSALVLYREGLRVAEECGDSAGMSSAWLNIGVALQRKGDYDASMEAALHALHLKEAIGDENGAARVMNNLSNLYWRQHDRPAAIAMLLKAIGIKRNLHDSLGLSNSLNGLAALMVEDGRADTAVVLLRQSMAILRSVAPEAELYAQLVNLGLAFHEAGQADSALHYYRSGMLAARQSEDPDGEVHALYGMAEVLMDQGEFREAGPLLDSSLAIAERIGSADLIKEAHVSLARQREAIGELALALEHIRRSQQLGDSLMNAEKDATMNELRVRYDTESKERENDELRAAQLLADLRAERNRWIALGIGLLALAGAVFTWATVQRNRHRAQLREAELEQQALRLQMDPHFLFNALNTVPGLYAGGDPAAANDHVGHLSKYLRLVLETSRRRTIPLSQEIELVEHYLRISANRRPGSFTWEVKVMPYVKPERLAVPPMLIQPVVENALEHGLGGVPKAHVSVLVDLAGSVLQIEVKDNGIGRKAAAQRPSRRNGSSMGIDLVRQRILLFDPQANLSDAVLVHDESTAQGDATGTTVTLRFRPQPLTEHAAAGDRG